MTHRVTLARALSDAVTVALANGDVAGARAAARALVELVESTRETAPAEGRTPTT